jgi:plastocyanin
MVTPPISIPNTASLQVALQRQEFLRHGHNEFLRHEFARMNFFPNSYGMMMYMPMPGYGSSNYGSSYQMPYGYSSYPMSNGNYGGYQMQPNAYGSGNAYGSSTGYGSNSPYDYSGMAGETNVGIYDNSFRPNPLVVKEGTTVRWTNAGDHRHTTTSDDGLWDSGELAPGLGYSHTFTKAGTYSYQCTMHGKEMRGVVIVK